MKVRITREDGKPFFGRKKVLTFGIDRYCLTLNNSCRKDWEVIDLDEEKWAVNYYAESMEEGECLEFQFAYLYDYERSVIPEHGLHWSMDGIEEEFRFIAEII